MRIRAGRQPASRPPTDAEIAAERLSRPLVRLVEIDGLPGLLVDLEGRLASDVELERIVAHFLHAARQAQRRRILAVAAESMPRGMTLKRLAAQWAVSPATLRRWTADALTAVLVVRADRSENERSGASPAAQDGTTVRPPAANSGGRAA